MIVLFVNAHKQNQDGSFLFKTYMESIKKILKETVYYGNEITQIVRSSHQLDDFIYDKVSFRMEEKARQKYQSLQYIFIDGCPSFAPWSHSFQDVTLLIMISLREGKHIHLNGFGHFASSYCLSTKFDKFYVIASQKNEKNHKQVDFIYEEKDGNLLVRNKRVCNSGIKIISSANRVFSEKSSQAQRNGTLLPTKFHYIVFDAKSGNKIIQNIDTPFSFYWKGKIFCTSKVISQAKVQVLFQTQNAQPLAFVYKNALSTQGLCTEFLKIIKNWIQLNAYGKISTRDSSTGQLYKSLLIDNKISFRKSSSYRTTSNSIEKTQLRPQTSKCSQRPHSSKFSTIQFEKPAIRCSGSYISAEKRFLQETLQKNKFNLGNNRMVFKGTLEEYKISNYVEGTPWQPSSSHKFRTIDKEKWISNDFFNI